MMNKKTRGLRWASIAARTKKLHGHTYGVNCDVFPSERGIACNAV